MPQSRLGVTIMNRSRLTKSHIVKNAQHSLGRSLQRTRAQRQGHPQKSRGNYPQTAAAGQGISGPRLQQYRHSHKNPRIKLSSPFALHFSPLLLHTPGLFFLPPCSYFLFRLSLPVRLFLLSFPAFFLFRHFPLFSFSSFLSFFLFRHSPA